MPHPSTPRPLRQSLQPMITGAVLASLHPGLTAHSIEIDHIGVATGDDPLGLRVFLYHPGDDVFDQWAKAIEATDFGEPRPTSRPGEMCHTITGRVGHITVGVTCVSLRGEWVWRTNTSDDVHKRDYSKDMAAVCGALIVGVADRARWTRPNLRCSRCANPEPAETGVR
ncbi:hypothetical protein [Streptomyces sp. NPDC086782]|uniref:hypothetical protein n=1 Tax=Streptomyces sp. NPDC086782 TaxID=3365757 RepID=UPI00380E22FC